MPSFLDFFFSFGKQLHNPHDFHFSGFRQQNRLRDVDKLCRVPELGRSGRSLRLCYSLRSVEPSQSQYDWPWSVRQTAVYHSFDVETGRAIWTIVKGDQLIKNRIQAVSRPQNSQKALAFGTVDQAFTNALAIHEMLGDWSNENWRWYIAFLEEKFQAISKHTLSRDVERVRTSISGATSSASYGKRRSSLDEKVPTLERRLTEISQYKSTKISTSRKPAQPVPPEIQEFPPSYRGPKDSESEQISQPFSFADLQKIQNIEEKATETLLILKINASVLTDLSEYYQSLIGSYHLINSCDSSILRLKEHIHGIEKDFQTHQLRVETLLSLLGYRKTLVSQDLSHGI